MEGQDVNSLYRASVSRDGFVGRRRRSITVPGTLLLTGLFIVPSTSYAADASTACSVIGLFDRQARALCEQASRKVQSSETASQSSGQMSGNGNSASKPTAYSPPPPPQSGYSRVTVAGNLIVDVKGHYPEGYGGIWTGVGAPYSVPVNQTWFVNRGEAKSVIQQPVMIIAPGEDKRAQFAFSLRGGTCYGDITGVDGPVLITTAPKTFRLSNLYMLKPNRVMGCPMSNKSNSFSGTATLSADMFGNINAQYTINVFDVRGVQQFRWEQTGYQIANNMTPDKALADVERKRVLAQQEAERAKKRAAQLARKLTPNEARLEQFIVQDSASWIVNRYDVKSVTNVKLVTPTAADRAQYGLPSGSQALTGDFSYASGARGYVRVGLRNNQIICVKFENESTCRPLGQPQSRGTAAALVVGALSDGGGNSAGISEDEKATYDLRYEERMREQMQKQNQDDHMRPHAPY